MCVDLDYLREQLLRAPFTPHDWSANCGGDKNLGAFRSRDELIEWYCQPPGLDGQPWRDRGFYTRELSYLSRLVSPKVVVEFGTSLGIGTCLLSWLNPEAHLTTVDLFGYAYLPSNRRVEIGLIAKHQGIKCNYLMVNSCEYAAEDVGLCFVDADHTYGAVIADSMRAWRNKASRWVIAWHDHNERHPGVVAAVEEFIRRVGVTVQRRPDSDTVWATNV